MPIHLLNDKQRDASVAYEHVRVRTSVRKVDHNGIEVNLVRLQSSDLQHNLEQQMSELSAEAVAQMLVDGDPEINIETFGRLIKQTQRCYVNSKQQFVHALTMTEVISGPDGAEKERRPYVASSQNIMLEEAPLRLSTKLMSKQDVYRKFVFTAAVQLVHANGLEYDFLYDIAQQLHQKDAMMRVSGGAKGTERLVFNRGGQAYFGFLSGKVTENSYCLVLHLVNLELKAPPRGES